MDIVDYPIIAERYLFPRSGVPTAGEPWSGEVPGATLAGVRVGRHGGRAVRGDELGVSDAELRRAIDERFDHRSKMSATRCPVLVLHTRHDGMVEKHHAERLKEWSADRGELALFGLGNHNTIHSFNGEEIRRRVIELAQ